MMLLFMKEATIAVLPATYQSERDATKDYASFENAVPSDRSLIAFSRSGCR